MAEAMVLSAGRLLDVEFNEIRSGYRIRYDENITYLDIFLFDSLSSGAGYCAVLADLSSELLTSTLEYLTACSCESSCHKCLNHFWNQRVQGRMNRHAAIDLLRWCSTNKLPAALSPEVVGTLAKPITELINSDDSQTCRIIEEHGTYFVMKNGKKKRLYFYPAMWSPKSSLIPRNAIALSDVLIKTALPNAYSKILSDVDAPEANDSETPVTTVNISFTGGLNMVDEDYSSIWDYALDDDDVDASQEDIIRSIKSKLLEGRVYEKPFYSPNVSFAASHATKSFRALLLWKNSKVILFAADDDDLRSMIENGSEWKCLFVDDIDDVDAFLRSIEV